MNKLILAFCLTIISGICAFAQSDYKKGEFYIGYSNNQVDSGIKSATNSVIGFSNGRETYNGFEASGAVNVNRYVGIKGDISGTYKKENNVSAPVTIGSTNGTVNFDATRSVYNFLAGVQVKDNSSDAKVKPFAHALIGAGHARFKASNVNCTGVTGCSNLIFSNSNTGFAGAFGGGLDIKANDKIDIRVIQVDYNPMFFSDDQRVDNIRFGFGIVFK